MRKFPFSLLLILFSLVTGCGTEPPRPGGVSEEYSAGEARVRMDLDRTEMNVAENLCVTLQVEYPRDWWLDLREALPGIDSRLPAGAAPDAPAFTVTDSEIFQAKTVEKADGAPKLLVITGRLRLAPFLAGAYTLPPLPLTFRDPAGKEIKLLTRAREITVKPVISETEAARAELREISGVKEIPHDWRWLLRAGAGILAAAAWALWRRFRHSARVEAPAPAIPPANAALDALEALLAQNLPARARYKEFFTELTGIVRTFLERQFALAAPEQTTEEFLHALAAAPGSFTPEQRQTLRDILEYGDLVKFAKQPSSTQEAAVAATQCRDFFRSYADAPHPGEPQ